MRRSVSGIATALCLQVLPVATLVYASDAQAQDVADMDVIKGCSTAPIGSEGCDADKLAESLGFLGWNDMREFGYLGMESFAMLTALRYGASAIAFNAYDDPCAAEEERYAAVEIWDLWVKLPEDAPQNMKDRFAVFEGVIENIREMETEC